jgi:hypothetical protein
MKAESYGGLRNGWWMPVELGNKLGLAGLEPTRSDATRLFLATHRGPQSTANDISIIPAGVSTSASIRDTQSAPSKLVVSSTRSLPTRNEQR